MNAIHIDLDIPDTWADEFDSKNPLAIFQANYERRADEDFAADRSGHRRAWEGSWS
jgi:hypothetical protein